VGSGKRISKARATKEGRSGSGSAKKDGSGGARGKTFLLKTEVSQHRRQLSRRQPSSEFKMDSKIFSALKPSPKRFISAQNVKKVKKRKRKR
jgi:hypothetical protein